MKLSPQRSALFAYTTLFRSLHFVGNCAQTEDFSDGRAAFCEPLRDLFMIQTEALCQGLQALAERFGLNHEEIAQRLAKGRSSVTEVLSLRAIPDEVKRSEERRVGKECRALW